MRALRNPLLPLLAFAFLLSACSTPKVSASHAEKPVTVDRIYVLYCGEMFVPDLAPWTGTHSDAATFSDNCYLIKHRDAWMMWDTGMNDAIAQKPEGESGPHNGRYRVRKTLLSQLRDLGIQPAQIQNLAFSHTHPDHMGNASFFTKATVYMQEAEYDAAFGPNPKGLGFKPELYRTIRDNPMIKLHGDYDVFGDGSVKIISTPGHTPGHQSLLVRLPKSGAVILSGDAVHFEENYLMRRVPEFNFNVSQSKDSMEKISRIQEQEHAKLWINHDMAQTLAFPHAPLFVE